MKTKKKRVFFCTNCGNEYPKWSGQCHACGEWNSLREEYITKKSSSAKKSADPSTLISGNKKSKKNKPLRINTVEENSKDRLDTVNKEVNRVLGSGLVKGSLVLLSGEPGVGKSTLLLQLALGMSTGESGLRILYASGEESKSQIKMRADRLSPSLADCDVYLFAETEIEKILSQANELEPDLIIVDSIQTSSVSYVDSTQGSVSQIKESSTLLRTYAKSNGIPIFIVGHVTKSGSIAGPKLLEHIVDVVLQFEGEQLYTYRTLRSYKNRFGSTHEIGIFDMKGDGLREITNPSGFLLDQSSSNLSGTAIGSMVEGRRPLFIETQALISKAVYGTPQRVTNGYDAKRVSMLLAVLEKRCGIITTNQDVYLNIAGGIKIRDTALDLALVASLISSHRNIVLDKSICFSGEIGLGGEIRALSHMNMRINEAERLGFKAFYASPSALKGLEDSTHKIKIYPVANVMALQDLLV